MILESSAWGHALSPRILLFNILNISAIFNGKSWWGYIYACVFHFQKCFPKFIIMIVIGICTWLLYNDFLDHYIHQIC